MHGRQLPIPTSTAQTRKQPVVRACLLGTLACLAVPLSLAHARTVVPPSLRTVDASATLTAAHVDLGVLGPAQLAVFTLDKPARVVVDVTPATWARQHLALPKAQGLIIGVRAGPHALGVRVVFDVASPVSVTRHEDPVSHRMALEFIRRGTPAEEVRQAPPSAPLVAPLMAASTSAPTPLPTPTPTVAVVNAAMPASVAPVAAPVAAVKTGTQPSTARAGNSIRKLVIAVDAGHGGEDPGASGRDGTHEKDVTLAVARELAQRINAEPGMQAVLTRAGDYFVPLRERSHRARVAQADLFVSVHADAVQDRSVAGSSVYVLSARGASSEAAKWLADRENAADLVGGVSLDTKDSVLASVLLDLSQSAAMSASMVAAGKVLEQLNQVGEVRKAAVQQAGFVVLKSPDIPSMLIESAYITNPQEERRLKDPHHQAELADAILAGIRNFFRENPPPGTHTASMVADTGPAAMNGRAPSR